MIIDKKFEMMFELVDIDSIEESGYQNCYDISVTGEQTFLLDSGIVSHNSATGGLMPAFGRKECGYYELKGKPLNAIKASHSDFLKNVELSELYSIIQSEGYEFIIEATDQDLDGFHIRGLLKGFVHKYLSEYKGNYGTLNTPVIGIKKNKKLTNWNYSLKDEVKLKSGEVSKYYKGLGSWTEVDLKHIVATDGISKMIELMDFDNDEVILDWLDDKRADIRKDYIMNNEFNIAKL